MGKLPGSGNHMFDWHEYMEIKGELYCSECGEYLGGDCVCDDKTDEKLLNKKEKKHEN